MKLTWVLNGFIDKELYAPYVIESDNEYRDNLEEKYNYLLEQANKAGADCESISIIESFKDKIIKSVDCYYHTDIERSNMLVRKLVEDIGENEFAVSKLYSSFAFLGEADKELQFFRSRNGDPSKGFSANDMLHLPFSKRAKTGNYRFSIPGNPCYYLANSSYGCWIETGFPYEHEFNVSPVLLDGTQKVFNLAVSISNLSKSNELEENRVHTWLKLFMLMIATSYRVNEEGRSIKSEYIISQAIMMACKKLGYSGVAYYSKRVSSDAFAFCAINLALFIDYDGEYSELVKHIKVDDSFNYSMFKNLLPMARNKEYELRSVKTGAITNIGNYDKQFSYNETEFFEFDKFLFAIWRDKINGKGKDQIDWGVEVDGKG